MYLTSKSKDQFIKTQIVNQSHTYKSENKKAKQNL